MRYQILQEGLEERGLDDVVVFRPLTTIKQDPHEEVELEFDCIKDAFAYLRHMPDDKVPLGRYWIVGKDPDVIVVEEVKKIRKVKIGEER